VDGRLTQLWSNRYNQKAVTPSRSISASTEPTCRTARRRRSSACQGAPGQPDPDREARRLHRPHRHTRLTITASPSDGWRQSGASSWPRAWSCPACRPSAWARSKTAASRGEEAPGHRHVDGRVPSRAGTLREVRRGGGIDPLALRSAFERMLQVPCPLEPILLEPPERHPGPPS